MRTSGCVYTYRSEDHVYGWPYNKQSAMNNNLAISNIIKSLSVSMCFTNDVVASKDVRRTAASFPPPLLFTLSLIRLNFSRSLLSEQF